MTQAASYGRRVLRNAGALTLARGLTMALNLATWAYLARVLEPERFGYIGAGLALVAYFVLPVNLGLNVLGAREVARAPERVRPLVGEVLGLRLVLVGAALAVYLGVVAVLPKPFLFKAVLAVQGLSLFGHALTLEWVYQGVERMGVLAGRNVAVAVLALAGAVAFVRSPDDVVLAALVTVVALIGGNGWLLGTYWREFGRPRPNFEWRGALRLARSALPVAGSLFMLSVYTNLDQLMLVALRPEEEVGWYLAAYKLLAASMVPGDILYQAFLPGLSSAYGDLGTMRLRGRGFAVALFVVGVPIAVGGAAVAPGLIDLFFGSDFAPAGLALSILMVNAGLVYLGKAYGDALIAWNRERPYMVVLAGGAVLNLVLNVLLIPPYGLYGAAFATALCAGAVLVGLVVLHVRAVHQLYLGPLSRVLAATALGVGVPVALGWHFAWPLGLVIGVSAAAYLVSILLFRAVDVRALQLLLRGRVSP